MTVIAQYRKKPVEIQAVQWTGYLSDLDALPSGWREAVELDSTGGLVVRTLEGPARCLIGSYLVRGTYGEFYPVRGDIFVANYEVAQR